MSNQPPPQPSLLNPKDRTKEIARLLKAPVRSVQRFRQSSRKIDQLQWVEEWKGNPPHNTLYSSLSDKQKEGKRYERAFGLHLGRLVQDHTTPVAKGKVFDGQWLRFADANGASWAQPDFYVVQPQCLWIFETKLTYREEGIDQLRLLYRPLLAELYSDLPQFLVLVCKDLVGASSGRLPPYTQNLDDVLDVERDWHLFQWRG